MFDVGEHGPTHHADASPDCQSNAEELLKGPGLHAEHYRQQGREDWDCGLHACCNHDSRKIYSQDEEELVEIQTQPQDTDLC